MSGPETPSKQYLRHNNDYNYEEYTKLVLLASIKNVGETLTPQNIKFPGFLVLGNKYYHRHSGNRHGSMLYHHRAGNNYEDNTKSITLGKRQVGLPSASCCPKHLAP